ncbi:family 10 glycosylhydrolase [Calditrichota bacterium GD2]
MLKMKLYSVLFLAIALFTYSACKKEKNAVSIDTSPPLVKILSPQSGSVLIEPVNIILSVTDESKISEVFIILDDDTLSRLTDMPYELYWNVGYWADGQNHALLAVAKDEAGNIGKSDLVNVIISKDAKIAPNLIEPANNAVLPEDSVVTFRWNGLTDAISYELQVATDTTFSEIIIANTIIDTSFIEHSLSAGTYFWRVRALNNKNKYSAWSSSFRFLKGNMKDDTAILGVWLWGATLSEQGATAVVTKLTENYVSDVFLLVKGISGSKTPASLITEFIRKAHDNNIKVHLWYVVSSDGVFINAHPQAHIYHCPKPSVGHNEPYPMDDERVNLLYPGYKEYVLNSIRYFVTNFDCDGIHLDYIRYSHFVYSFDEYHLKKADSLGCNTERLLNLFVDNYDYYAYNEGFVNLYFQGDSDVVKWVELRKNVVYDYIKSIKELIAEIKPDLKLSAAFMPEGATNPQWADSYYAQNYALNAELLDFIAPMSYFKDYGKTTSWVKTVTEQAIELVNDNCKICAGVQSYGEVTATQVREQIIYAQQAGAHGAVFFRYGATTEDEWQVIKELFSQWPNEE